MTRRFWLGVVVGAVLASGVGVAYASIPDSSGVFNACANAVNGRLRVIDPAAGGKCTKSERGVAWNVRGPAGPQGDPGPPGPKGDPGPPGSSPAVDTAWVSAAGKVQAGTATRATQLYSGQYAVTFPHDVRSCFAVATPGGGYSSTGGEAFLRTLVGATDPDEVVVTSTHFSDGATGAPTDFMLLVVC